MSKHVSIVLLMVMVLPCAVVCRVAAETKVQDDHNSQANSEAEKPADANSVDPSPAEPDASDEHASSEHAELPPLLNMDIGAAVWNLAIFLATFAILACFVWPPILKGLQAREDKIRTDLEAAEQAHLKANSLLEEYQKKLDESQNQVQAMLTEARHDAESAGQRIIQESKDEAGRHRDRAIADIDNAKNVALSDIAGQTSHIAIDLAKKVVSRELKADDHAELIRQSLDGMVDHNSQD